ncbi:type III secretion system export apparatus subunit SctT [Novosphingobium kaempferiae]|uniref:type III secretion system export apparatus subunit SctT n=1 Tax=Novosphingobium kaempferiae TaxID=2896849 RepID=UPI001E5F0DD2|nr:type III secretion system export apparatus subunit SctT [Novosphingobium kaempferiae]
MDATYVTGVLLPLAYTLLSGAAVAVARAMGMVMMTPAFTRLGLTGMIRSSVAVVISLPMIPSVLHAMPQGAEQPGAVLIAMILIKELAVGCVIGLVFGVPFWAAEVAGDLVDLQRGSTMAQLVDPGSATESTIMATLLTITMVALFFMSGAFLLLLDGLYRSYDLWPAASMGPVLREGAFPLVLGLLDRIMQTALVLIAPVVVALLIAEVMLAFLSRMSPQLNIFDLSLSVKNLIFCLVILLYAVFLVPLMVDQFGMLKGAQDILRALAGN